MGVNGLWKLLEPTALPVQLESLRGKTLAIDASIWIYHFLKAMRDPNGRILAAAHIVGFFRRICKLLFLEIRPVFVFDGRPPILKKLTTERRSERRQGREQTAKATANKLLAVQLHRAAVAEAERRQAKQNGEDEDADFEIVNLMPGGVIRHDEQSQPLPRPLAVAQPKPAADQFSLPEIDGIGGQHDERFLDADELEEYSKKFTVQARTGFIDSTLVDFKSQKFESLPVETRYQLLNMARLKSRLRMGYSAEELAQQFPDEMDFSRFQIERVAQRNYFTQRLMNLVGMDEDLTRRVSSEKNREYILKRTSAGYVMSLNNGNDEQDNSESSEPHHIDESDPLVDVSTSLGAPSANASTAARDVSTVLGSGSDDSLFEETDGNSDFEDVDLAPEIQDSENEDENRGDLFDPANSEELENKLKALPEWFSNPGLSAEGVQEVRSTSVLEKDWNLVKAAESDGSCESEDTGVSEIDDLELSSTAVVGIPTVGVAVSSNNDTSSQSDIEDQAPLTSASGSSNHSTDPVRTHELDVTTRQVDHGLQPTAADRLGSYKSKTSQETSTTKSSRSDDHDQISGIDAPTSCGSAEADIKPQVPTAESKSVTSSEKVYAPSHYEDSDQSPSVHTTISPTDSVAAVSNESSVTSSKSSTAAEETRAAGISRTGNLAPAVTNPPTPKSEFDPGSSLSEIHLPVPEASRSEIEEISVISSKKEPKLDKVAELELAKEEELEDEEQNEEIASMLIAEAEENARFAQTLAHDNNRAWTQKDSETYEDYVKDLRKQFAKQARDSDTVTTEIVQDCQQLLQLFGIPYITAPSEAEAQCAELRQLNLVEGVVTDDGDTFLFDDDARVYRNMFSQARFVECYTTSRIKSQLGLDRHKLIELAFLLGSDYTEGVVGIGPVSGVEIIAEFETLKAFAEWWRSVQLTGDEKLLNTPLKRRLYKQFKTKMILPDSFPSKEVIDAYLHPSIDPDSTKFVWGYPNLDSLRAFMMETAGWDVASTNALLLPVVQEAKRRALQRKMGDAYKQSSLHDYYQTIQDPLLQSKRARKAAETIQRRNKRM